MAVPVKVNHLPSGRTYGRPGYKLKGNLSFTVHNTANERAGADAEAHDTYLRAGRGISWHATADHDSIIEHLPLDEQGWHTGTNAGNTTSIGIEVCEYPATKAGRAKQAAATANAAWWIAKQLHARGMQPTAKTVRTHKSWSGKECPRDILPHWAKTPPKPAPRPRMPLLRRGSVGGAVRTLQADLNKSFPRRLVVDGIFGPRTDAAVRAFQKKKRIGIDGIVGPITWKALGR